MSRQQTAAKRERYALEIPASVGERIARRARQEKRKPAAVAVDALQRYFALPHFPEETPTASELRAIRHGEAEIKRGEYAAVGGLRP
jgi:hypothetical protein